MKEAVGKMTGLKKDGFVLLLGMIAGIAAFGELYPFLEEFYRSTSMGQITLPDILHISYGAAVFGVVLMALAGFAGAEWIETRSQKATGVENTFPVPLTDSST